MMVCPGDENTMVGGEDEERSAKVMVPTTVMIAMTKRAQNVQYCFHFGSSITPSDSLGSCVKNERTSEASTVPMSSDGLVLFATSSESSTETISLSRFADWVQTLTSSSRMVVS